MITRLPRIVLTLAVAGVLIAAVAVPIVSDDYEVTAVMPASHPKLREGSPVYVNGFETGEIVSLRPENNKALLTLRLDDEVAPLHSGATVRLKWKSLVGERVLFVQDGAAGNPPVPDGGRVEGNPAHTEVGDILERLDPKTREHLGSLITRLQGTLDGHERDMNDTLRAAGPALAALGNVLRAVGSDGPAIRSLVTNMNALMSQVEQRSADTQNTINALSRTANAVAAEREKLRLTLAAGNPATPCVRLPYQQNPLGATCASVESRVVIPSPWRPGVVGEHAYFCRRRGPGPCSASVS